jgi:ubiquinone/menaquinone biosynthesis C-methylase UbiE
MIRHYFNEKSAIWDENVAEKDTDKLKQMVGRLDIERNSVVLDIGTGTGVFLPFVFDVIGKNGRIIAMDIAEEMLKKAAVKLSNGNIDYIQANVECIPLPEKTFNVVICYSSFPHFQDKLKALNEMKRVLKSNGRLFICHTSSRNTINDIHLQIPVVKNDLLPDRVQMHTMLLQTGFSNVIVDDGVDSYLASAEKI